MEVSLVREEVARGDASQSIVPFELFDEEFDAGTVVVEAPEVERLQGQIRNQDLVVIPAQLEQRQLFGGLLGLRPSDDDEAVGVRPPGGLVAELGHLDSWAGAYVAQVRQLAFDRGGQAGDDDEVHPLLLQPRDQRVIVKSFVGADNDRPDSAGNLRQARGKQVQRSAGSMNIARPQLAVPEVLALALETEQRVIRGAPSLDWVVTAPRLLLLTVDDKHGGVDVENKSCKAVRRDRHALKKLVVQRSQPWECDGGNAQQKTSQCRCVGIARQAGEILKDTILAQQLRGFDPFQSENHRIEQGQQHFANAVAVVALNKARLLSKAFLEPEATEEAVKQIHPTVVSQ